MSSKFNVQTDDLIVFFTDSQGRTANRWLPKSVYANEAIRVAKDELDKLAPGWEGTIVAEKNGAGSDPWYLANFSRVRIPPVVENAPAPDEAKPALDRIAKGASKSVKAGSLVVVPFGEGTTTGYVLQKDVFEACPELPPELAADLEFMVIDEGVVFANVPKLEPTGICCLLLGLSNLRSGTHASVRQEDKTALARAHRSAR